MITRDWFQHRLATPGVVSLAVICLLASVPGGAAAQEASSVKLSGFISIVDGRVLSSGMNPTAYAANNGAASANGVNAPFYTADWSNAGVYDGKYSIAPESHAGLQASVALSDRANLVGQLVVRGTDGTPDITWAYGSYKINQNWEVQLGRKRIPLYYYSDFQDIGVSYPWVSPPPELYGWDATNYNGASARYSTSVGGSNVAGSIFAGRENLDKSAYNKLFFSGDTQVTWDNIVGGDIEINNGPVTVRAVYLKAKTHTVNNDNGYDAHADLSAYGLAANLDFDSWFVLSEVTSLKREFAEAQYSYTAPAYTIGAGLRLGKWTPFVNFARYAEQSSDVSKYVPQLYQRTSLTLRYDLAASSAVKAQIDSNKDVSNNFGGDTVVFRVSYDRVF